MALTGTAAPFVWYLNRRFSRRPVPSGVLMRQAVWVGFVVVTCAWLQLARTLNWATALLMAAGLAGIGATAGDVETEPVEAVIAVVKEPAAPAPKGKRGKE